MEEETELLKRISIDPAKRFGKPIIRGLRFTVGDMLELLASGMTYEEILYDHPDLEPDDIRASLIYASRLANHRHADAA